MHSFTDTQNRVWTVAINFATVRRVRDMLKIDLVANDIGSVIEKIVSDPIVLGDVLYVIVKPQADELKISDIQFGEGLAGDAVEEASKAFFDELADFTPNPRNRARVKKVIEAMWNLTAKLNDKADADLQAALPQLESLVSGPKSGDSAESSESQIPVR